MVKQYHLDFKAFSLEKLKKSIQQRKMIPSRVILKEDIDDRFKRLEQVGITDLKNLVDSLKTKEMIAACAGRTGLSEEYLTILKREVNSYQPNPISLGKLPGVDQEVIAALSKIGVNNTKQFFSRVILKNGMKSIAAETKVPEKELEKLAALSDLARLYGVGPVFADILYSIGVTSVEAFLSNTAEELISLYEEKTGKTADFGEADINFSLELAKELSEAVKP